MKIMKKSCILVGDDESHKKSYILVASHESREKLMKFCDFESGRHMMLDILVSEEGGC